MSERRDVFAGLPGIFREAVEPGRAARLDLRFPAVMGEMVYATDGRIAVRSPAEMCDPASVESIIDLDRGEEMRLWPMQSIRAIFAEEFELDPEPTPIPEDVTPRVPCDECGGNGISSGEKCADCGGAGSVIFPEGVDLAGGYRLNRRTLDVLRRHGAVLYLPADKSSTFPAVFRGVGYDGRMMPMGSI